MSSKKRLIFCTYSSIYSSIVLEQLLSNRDLEVVAIINSTRVFKLDYGYLRGAIEQIKTTGWRYATYIFMVTDVFNYLQRLFKASEASLKSIHVIAKKESIPLHETRDINKPSSLDFISQQSADVLVAAHFNQLIKSDILEKTELECLNIHPSLLPAYKGVDPVFYALFDNEIETGVTLHRMSERFDTGEVLLQDKTHLSAKDSLFSKNNELFLKGAKLVSNYLSTQKDQKGGRCASTSLELLPFDKFSRTASFRQAQGNYDSWPTAETVSEYKKLGKQLIDIKYFWQVIRENTIRSGNQHG